MPIPTPYRSFIGLGAFVGSGIYSELGGGPYLLLGVVPSSRLSSMHIEFESSWTSQTAQSVRMHSFPLVSSLCLVRGVIHFCSGLATTIFHANQSSNDELHLTFGGSIRVGTELFIDGPLSIRADVFGRFAFTQVPGNAEMALDDPTPFAAGLAVMGAWLFD